MVTRAAPAPVAATSEQADPLAAVAARAESLRLQGNQHFGAGRTDEAAALYGEGIAAAAAPPGAAESSALAREGTLCHLNRARCALRQRRFAAALDDTWAAAEACLTPSGPHRRVLRADAGWEWTQSSYLKAALLRARAAKAAGVLLSAQPHVLCASRMTLPAGSPDAATLKELKNVEFEITRTSGELPASASADCVVAGAWSKLRVAPGAPVPVPRRAAAAAVVAGYIYVFGGEKDAARRAAPNSRSVELGDAWRVALDLSADGPQTLCWEKLPTPAVHGGPLTSVAPRGAACHALSLFVVAARGALWALPAGAAAPCAAWRALGPLWPKARGACYENDPDYALTVCGAAAFAVRAMEGVVRVCLRSGVRDKLHGSGGAGGPMRASPLLWPAAGCGGDVVRLRLWGGEAPLYHDEEALDPPRGTDMLIFQHSAWGVEPRGGSGAAVPLPRDEAALAPLPRGGALLFGGFTDQCGAYMPPPDLSTVGEVRISMQGSRLLNDAHLYDEAAGWRAVRAAGQPPCPRAQPCAAQDAASGVIVVFGGWCDAPRQQVTANGPPGVLASNVVMQDATVVTDYCQFGDVYVLRVDGVGPAPHAAEAAPPAPAPAPMVMTPEPATEEVRCECCGAAEAVAGGRLARCGRCRRARYCSPACQRAAWPLHKAACAPPS